MKVPKFYKKDGSEDVERAARYERIVHGLAHLKGTTVPCPALGGVDVIISNAGIEEVAYHASKSIKSTSAALDIVNQIRKAGNPKVSYPKTNQQTNKFRFIAMFVLSGRHDGNTTKITIGAKSNGKYLQYCLTVVE